MKDVSNCLPIAGSTTTSIGPISVTRNNRVSFDQCNLTSGYRAVCRESWWQRRSNSAATHPCDVIDTVIDWEEIGER